MKIRMKFHMIVLATLVVATQCGAELPEGAQNCLKGIEEILPNVRVHFAECKNKIEDRKSREFDRCMTDATWSDPELQPALNFCRIELAADFNLAQRQEIHDTLDKLVAEFE